MNKSKHNFDRQSRRIDSLTGARFLAIMIIVFNHFEFLKDYGSFGRTYWNWWHNATMGVDFFFMMSGFGMMLSSIRRDPSGSKPVGGLHGSLKFGIHHVKKIYPIYFTMLLIGIPYAVLSGIFEYGGNLITQIIKEVILFFGDLTLLQTATGRDNFILSLNGVCWFLSSLFCIYLVSPFIMQWLKRHVKTVRTAIVGVVICIICSYLLAILFTNIEDKTWFFDDLCYSSPYRRVFYVIPGMLLAQVYTFHQQDESYCMPVLFSSGAFEYLSIGFSMVWFFWWHQFSETYWVYIVNMIVVACDLYAIAIRRGKISHLFETKPMIYLGNISIYIFITHYLIRMYVDFIVRMTGIGSLPVAICEVVIILLLTFVASLWLNKKNGKLAYFDRIVDSIRPKKKTQIE